MQNTPEQFTYLVREEILGPVRALHFTNGGVHTLDCSPELQEAVGSLIPEMTAHDQEPVTILGKLIGKGHGGAGFNDLGIIQFVATHAVFHGKITDDPDVIDQLCPNMPFAILPVMQGELWEEDPEDTDLDKKLRFFGLSVEYGDPVKESSPLIKELYGEDRPGNGVQIDVAVGDTEVEDFDPFYDIFPLRSAG